MNKKRSIATVLLLALCFSSLPSGAVVVSEKYDMSTEYLLGPGDVLEVHAWDDKQPDLLYVNPIPAGVTTALGDPHTMTVSVDGRLYIPVLGTIYVKGLTIRDIEKALIRSIRKMEVTGPPQVSVFLKIPKGVNVDVLGEVGSPGTKSIPDGDPQFRSIINYLQAAGGLSSFADSSNIKVIRKMENGETETLTVDLRKISTDRELGQNIILQTGDTVIVGRTTKNNVRVMGEANGGGLFPYTQGDTVADYIVAAGGLKKNSAADSIRIIRNNVNDPIIKNIKLSKYFSEGKKDQTQVLPGDIIYVDGDWTMAWGNALTLLGIARDTAILFFFFSTVVK
ncbi:MAG: polysaccharide biosynthesis/export family protein [bacterium]